ncbi:hypothetical protein G7048_03670 [Diaphorobacter sp. HDW4B]|uniref:capsular polysaccharide export protein, LipB/KpsS family n=1 Tax=Diaphorobacter sp. HDW4B TaxID=2714925 RepID=UPI00140E7C80|nr:hypothetical protein [Diaphorobacter sp. HDW4B]QIL69549.1 hypothetical protein G7048_03670 [Diaphorobacter sp. HDW4B]
MATMKILMLLEPVGYREGPQFLTCHLFWADLIDAAVRCLGGILALASNNTICEHWQAVDATRPCFAIDEDAVLADFGGDRHFYAKTLYRKSLHTNYLCRRLKEIKQTFEPDLVLMTSQNEFVRCVFAATPQLWLEQSPLPRLGQPFRTFFDPCGHQVGSMLETCKQDIISLALDPLRRSQMEASFERAMQFTQNVDPRADSARQELAELRVDHKVALLATQPSDWVTFEGAGGTTPLRELVLDWAHGLPPGWIGVPTLHPGDQAGLFLSELAPLKDPKLYCLSPTNIMGLTDALIPKADGLVTLSSSCAMSALLLQKPVVVTGSSPFRTWGVESPAQIEQCAPLTDDQVVGLLAFLTNRYSFALDDMRNDPNMLGALFVETVNRNGAAHAYFDLSGWRIEKFNRLFCWTEGQN